MQKIKPPTVLLLIGQQPTEKEFSSRAWHIIKTLSDQLGWVIKLENRFENAPPQDPNSEKIFLFGG